MEAMEYNPDDYPDEDPMAMSAYNPDFMQSQTSFRSMMSGATVMTQNQRELKKLVHKTISAEDDLDVYMEQLLDIERRKNAKLQKQFMD
jgi:hypothetical protein